MMSGKKDVGELLVAIVVAMCTSKVESNPSLTQAAWSCSLFMLASEWVSGAGASSSVMLLVRYGANVLLKWSRRKKRYECRGGGRVMQGKSKQKANE